MVGKNLIFSIAGCDKREETPDNFLVRKPRGDAAPRAIDRVEAHSPVTNMDLEPIAVMLQFVRPARSTRWLLGDDWLARMDESSGRIQGPAARATQTKQHSADIGQGT